MQCQKITWTLLASVKSVEILSLDITATNNLNEFIVLQRAAYYAWDEYNCIDFPQSFYDTASSLRYTGAPDGYKYDTLNFYEGQYFMGNEQYFYQDAPQFNIDNLGE